MMQIFLGGPSNRVQLWMKAQTRATTIITTEEDGAQEFLIEGTIDRQWMIDHEFCNNNYEWSKTIIAVDIGVGSQEHPLTSIGDYVFLYCTSLTSVTIPNSVTNIGTAAFCRCSDLTSMTIGNGVTSIGEGAFYACNNLSELYINSMTVSDVFDNSRGWSLGIDDMDRPLMVVVYCSDGVLVINDGGQDDSRP